MLSPISGNIYTKKRICPPEYVAGITNFAIYPVTNLERKSGKNGLDHKAGLLFTHFGKSYKFRKQSGNFPRFASPFLR